MVSARHPRSLNDVCVASYGGQKNSTTMLFKMCSGNVAGKTTNVMIFMKVRWWLNLFSSPLFSSHLEILVGSTKFRSVVLSFIFFLSSVVLLLLISLFLFLVFFLFFFNFILFYLVLFYFYIKYSFLSLLFFFLSFSWFVFFQFCFSIFYFIYFFFNFVTHSFNCSFLILFLIYFNFPLTFYFIYFLFNFCPYSFNFFFLLLLFYFIFQFSLSLFSFISFYTRFDPHYFNCYLFSF